jgi:S-DNA-T family DNA segregation ATPase FtsK/SpoIIIE
MTEQPTTAELPARRLRLVDTAAHPTPEVEDAETVVVDLDDTAAAEAEVPVSLSWADLTTTRAARTPVVPAWLRNRAERAATLRALGDNLRYLALFHLLRVPNYAAKVAVYAPLGALRTVGRLLRWATAEGHNFALRQHAATTNDAYTWQALNRIRARESRGRWWAVALLALAVLVATATAGRLLPSASRWALLAAAVLVAARAGRPADRPITDRTSARPRFTKLTADMVRAALVALNLPGMKEPGSVDFPHPGIHRDGPGWLARVNLPAGLEAVRVLERRGGLSSALRLPVDQVWPSAGPDHAGQLDLWVGYQPASRMGRPAWSLAAPAAVASVFDAHEFGTDERQRPVCCELFARSFLIGGQPGSGKSYAARAVATIALLDPTCELKIAEFKGTGDFIDLAPCAPPTSSASTTKPSRTGPPSCAGDWPKPNAAAGASSPPRNAAPHRWARSPPSWPASPDPGCIRC